MIRKLRRKFILISVTVLSAALLLLAAVINAVNWAAVRQEIADNASELSVLITGEEHSKGKNQHGKHTETLYESRYFTVIAGGKSGLSFDMTNIASYTEEEAQSLYEEVQTLTSDSGMIDDCYYIKYTSENRSAVLFLDCTTRLDAARKLVWISLGVSLAGILISWLVMALLSRRAIQPILENSEKQKRFITDASHELKTPLSVISANMELMAMDDPENEWILSTRRQVGLMNRMVRDLVFLTRADEENRRPQPSDFDLAQLLKDTADPFVMMAEAGKHAFAVETPEHLNAHGDPKGIERLISVLCDNALKYSPEDDKISLRLTQKGAYAVIETENTPAEPISDEKMKHLFDRFYRADESRTKKDEKTGFGIGLAIALAVAESHDGGAKAFMQDGRIHIVCRLKVCAD